jgi:hypothetical protein
MSYTPPYPLGWQDFPDTSTPIDAASLDIMDAGIAAAQGTANQAITNAAAARLVSFHAERNGVPTVGNYYAFGNGGTTTFCPFPFAAKLVGASFTQMGQNGNITVQFNLNGALQSGRTLTSTNAAPTATIDWRSNPLSITAGSRFTWEVTSVTSTTGTSVVQWILLVD